MDPRIGVTGVSPEPFGGEQPKGYAGREGVTR